MINLDPLLLLFAITNIISIVIVVLYAIWIFSLIKYYPKSNPIFFSLVLGVFLSWLARVDFYSSINYSTSDSFFLAGSKVLPLSDRSSIILWAGILLVLFSGAAHFYTYWRSARNLTMISLILAVTLFVFAIFY